jgi:hypothetical protein
MAGQKPGLVTGSNAKLKIGGKTIAYATDVSYAVTVDVVPVEVMGRYEVITNEPIAVNVAGSFSIVRYTSTAAGADGRAANGNGVGQFGAGQGNAFNPSQMLSTSTVDIEIFQRNAPGADPSELLVKIEDCRLTRLTSGISKRGVMVENYDFVGVIYDDDSFVAGKSGNSNDLT